MATFAHPLGLIGSAVGQLFQSVLWFLIVQTFKILLNKDKLMSPLNPVHITSITIFPNNIAID